MKKEFVSVFHETGMRNSSPGLSSLSLTEILGHSTKIWIWLLSNLIYVDFIDLCNVDRVPW